MLRTSREVRALGSADRDLALEICAADPIRNVYVAARVLEADLDAGQGSLFGYSSGGVPTSLCWMSANVVPVEGSPAALTAFAHRARRRRAQFSSVFGPAAQVDVLWSHLRSVWRGPLDVRSHQPLLAIGPGDPLLVAPDPRVRLTRLDEVDLLLPAAAAMFTEEIGYAPFSDARGRAAYGRACRTLVERGHAFVVVEGGDVLFKAEVGSVGLGVCQVQGVWVAPSRRGEGIAAPAMAAVVEQARATIAPTVTLYVNDFNTPALAAYRRVGFTQVGEFATVLL